MIDAMGDQKYLTTDKVAERHRGERRNATELTSDAGWPDLRQNRESNPQLVDALNASEKRNGSPAPTGPETNARNRSPAPLFSARKNPPRGDPKRVGGLLFTAVGVDSAPLL